MCLCSSVGIVMDCGVDVQRFNSQVNQNFCISFQGGNNQKVNKIKNKNSSNSLVFGRWPQTKTERPAGVELLCPVATAAALPWFMVFRFSFEAKIVKRKNSFSFNERFLQVYFFPFRHLWDIERKLKRNLFKEARLWLLHRRRWRRRRRQRLEYVRCRSYFSMKGC